MFNMFMAWAFHTYAQKQITVEMCPHHAIITMTIFILLVTYHDISSAF